MQRPLYTPRFLTMMSGPEQLPHTHVGPSLVNRSSENLDLLGTDWAL